MGLTWTSSHQKLTKTTTVLVERRILALQSSLTNRMFQQDLPKHNTKLSAVRMPPRRTQTTKRMLPRQESSRITLTSTPSVVPTLTSLGSNHQTVDTPWQRQSTTGTRWMTSLFGPKDQARNKRTNYGLWRQYR